MLDSNLSNEMCSKAVYFSTYVTNRCHSSSLNKTSFEIWEGRKPNSDNLRVFGSTAYNHVPTELRKKLHNKVTK